MVDEVSNGGYVRQGWVLNVHIFAAVSGRTRERDKSMRGNLCLFPRFFLCNASRNGDFVDRRHSAGGGGGGGGEEEEETYLESLNPLAL